MIQKNEGKTSAGLANSKTIWCYQATLGKTEKYKWEMYKQLRQTQDNESRNIKRIQNMLFSGM